MGKKKRGRESPPPRLVSAEAPRSRSWVKHGHKKLYLLSGIVLVAIILGVWALSSASTSQSGAPKVSQVAPDLTFTTMNGTSSSLSAYRGHPVVLWWIATWCTSCQDGTSLFARNYYSQYNAAGIILLQIESYNNLGQPGPSLSSFASSNSYLPRGDWILGQGSQEGTSTYNPSGYLDYFYVISSNGNVLDARAGLPQFFATALQEARGS